MLIYDIANTDHCIAVTEPTSLRQILQALKAEGLIARNCRYASYTMQTFANAILVYKAGQLAFTLHSNLF